MKHNFVILTGVSGSGKTLALKSLEDVGYFCIDNMPTPLILNLLENKDTILPYNEKVAFVVDIRNGEDFHLLINAIQPLQKEKVARVVYLDSTDGVLINRYKETRRKHPLMHRKDFSLEKAVAYEKDILRPLLTIADFVIDSSLLSSFQMKDRLLTYVINDEKKVLTINVVSFGFKFGVPNDIDMLFDVRCLLNPFYIKELRDLTGNDEKVSSYVLSFDEAQELYKNQTDLLKTALPLYIKEGETHLTIAYGCTGGKHRSITFANKLYDDLKEQGYQVMKYHRDEFRRKA